MGLSSDKHGFQGCFLEQWPAGPVSLCEKQNTDSDAHGAALESCTKRFSNGLSDRAIDPLEISTKNGTGIRPSLRTTQYILSSSNLERCAQTRRTLRNLKSCKVNVQFSRKLKKIGQNRVLHCKTTVSYLRKKNEGRNSDTGEMSEMSGCVRRKNKKLFLDRSPVRGTVFYI